MSKIYIVTKRESGIYEEDGVWFSILAAFDTRNKAEEYLKEYEKTAPKEAYYTFYRIEPVPLFLSSHKVKINRPKHTTYHGGPMTFEQIKKLDWLKNTSEYGILFYLREAERYEWIKTKCFKGDKPNIYSATAKGRKMADARD